MSNLQEKRVLLFAVDEFSQVCRMPKHLRAADFRVAALAWKGNSLFLSTYLDEKYPFVRGAVKVKDFYPNLRKACELFKPDIIMPCDEVSVKALNSIYSALAHDFPGSHKIKDLITFSRGNPDFYDTVRHKHQSTRLAAKNGIRIPAQMPCSSLADVQTFAAEHGYPVVLKGAYGLSGSQVVIFQSFACAKKVEHKFGGSNEKVVQQYITGKPVGCTASALGGKVFAAGVFKYEVCVGGGTGYSTVVRFIDHPEIIEQTKKFAAATGISGIFTLDFMLDAQNKSYLIECNPRPIESSHQGHHKHRNRHKEAIQQIHDIDCG